MAIPSDRLAGLRSLAIADTDFAQLAAVRDYSRIGDHFIAIRLIGEVTLERGIFAEEWHDGQIVDIPETVPGIHIVAAGTPHRAKSVQGYWHIDPRDELIMTVPGRDEHHPAYRFVVETVRRPGEFDRVAWFCRSCHGPLVDVPVAEAVVDIPALEEDIEVAVLAFNRDELQRTCRQCGVLHPFAYSPLTPPSAGVDAARQEW